MSAQNKDYVRDSEIDNILAQVQKKRASAGAAAAKPAAGSRKSRDAELDEIMRGLGFESKKPGYMDPILLPDPTEAVSYTHLDVYKRQGQHRCGQNAAAAGCG